MIEDAKIDGMHPANIDDVIIPGEYIALQFSDNGSGIPENIINKILILSFLLKKKEKVQV